MTVFMSLRQSAVGGGVKDPSFFEGNGMIGPGELRALQEDRLVSRASGRDVFFAVHGFNVSLAEGACTLGRLEAALDLPPSCLFIGVLWPGDYWLPIVNYPFEGETAINCGRRVADYCNIKLKNAASISFVTHSLGARLALEATKLLGRKARSVCLTAAAINDDCLTAQYAAAYANSQIVYVLASRRDLVLKLAFPIGDPISNVLRGDHDGFRRALGYEGPASTAGARIPHWQIADDENTEGYGHGDYLPPSDPAAAFPDPEGPWVKTVAFMERARTGQPQTWPR